MGTRMKSRREEIVSGLGAEAREVRDQRDDQFRTAFVHNFSIAIRNVWKMANHISSSILETEANSFALGRPVSVLNLINDGFREFVK
jgi:hypothetical protein